MAYPRIELNEVRAYATQANLRKGLEKFGLDKYQHIECLTPAGKWTAIFTFANARLVHEQCYLGFASQYGFMTV